MKKGVVVITHGLFMKPIVMRPLASMLLQHGWNPVVVGYPSRSIDQEAFRNAIDMVANSNKGVPIHFLGHSLGGLVLKDYCENRDLPKGTRLVSLGTPHQGANIVNRLDAYRIGFIVGNAREHGLLPDKPRVWSSEVEVGTLAGNVDTGLLRMLGGQMPTQRSDGIVLVDEAKIEGSKDHIEVNSSHTTMIYSRRVSHYVNHFFDTGRFN